jgi:preprotein translocase subunit SecB
VFHKIVQSINGLLEAHCSAIIFPTVEEFLSTPVSKQQVHCIFLGKPLNTVARKSWQTK